MNKLLNVVAVMILLMCVALLAFSTTSSIIDANHNCSLLQGVFILWCVMTGFGLSTAIVVAIKNRFISLILYGFIISPLISLFICSILYFMFLIPNEYSNYATSFFFFILLVIYGFANYLSCKDDEVKFLKRDARLDRK